MTAYTGQTRMTLGQLCAALWDSQSRPIVTQPGLHRARTSNLIEHLWDSLECRLQARPNCPTSMPTSLMRLWLNGSKSLQQCLSSGKPSQKSGGCYSSKRVINSIFNACDFGLRCLTSRCAHNFDHVLYITSKTL